MSGLPIIIAGAHVMGIAPILRGARSSGGAFASVVSIIDIMDTIGFFRCRLLKCLSYGVFGKNRPGSGGVSHSRRHIADRGYKGFP